MGIKALGRHHRKVAELRAVASRKREGLTLVDGPKLVRDLWLRGVEPLELFTCPENLPTLTQEPFWSAFLPRTSCYTLAREVLVRIAPTQHSQGLLAVYPVPKQRELAGRLLVYLDRVQDPANVGALVRVAAALGASGVACSPGCADPFSPKAIRAAAGTSLFFPVASQASWEAFRQQFSSHEVVAAVAAGGQPLAFWRPCLPMILVLGNEGQGLAPTVASHVRQSVTIPLRWYVESLNVAVACGILLARVQGLVGGPILMEEGGRHDSSQGH